MASPAAEGVSGAFGWAHQVRDDVVVHMEMALYRLLW